MSKTIELVEQDGDTRHLRLELWSCCFGVWALLVGQ
jgi:hypothetical protein